MSFLLPRPYLLRIGLRYLLRHPYQSALMIIGITLGVAVAVAVDLANASAARAFDLSTEAVTGRATHQITGGPQGLDEGVYTQLVVSGAAEAAAPVVSEYVSSPQLGDRLYQLLGIDPFTEPPFRNYLEGDKGLPLNQLIEFLTQPGAILISSAVAEDYGLQACRFEERVKVPTCQLILEIGGERQAVWIAGTLDPTGDSQASGRLSQRALEGLILVDIATAQELTGQVGKLDHIDLILPEECLSVNTFAIQNRVKSCPQIEELRALLPSGATLLSVGARTGVISQMTAAFRLNLTALSLLALVVGMFLIYNTMTFSVIQRRPLFGTLRCLGVTRTEVFLLVIGEALVVGSAAAALGVGLGVLMGQGVVRMVTQTINDLYFVLTVRGVQLPVLTLLKGLLLGVVATVLTVVPPAMEAAGVAPRAALIRAGLERKAKRAVNLAALVGVGLFLIGGILLLVPTQSLVASFLGTFAVIVGFAMLAPISTRLILVSINGFPWKLGGILGRMAPRNLVNAQSRTAVAIAALMVAVSVTIGVSLMVRSFRHTVVVWLDQTLLGDVYLSAPTQTATEPSAPLDRQVVEKVSNWPGAERVDVLRSVYVESPYGPIHLAATDNPTLAFERIFLSAKGDPQIVQAALLSGAVLVSEPLAYRLELTPRGETIRLQTAEGEHDFPVAGIYYDYASSQGTVLMNLAIYRRWWKDEALSAMALRLPEAADADKVADELEQSLTPVQALEVRPNRELRADVLVVFDRTFAITGALQILATIVAFIGVLSALLSMQLERQRELGILRAVGLTTRQLWGLVMVETGLMGSLAGLLAMPTGFTLALILIYIINRRSFGWTLQMQIEPWPFLQALGVSIIAAVLAGLYPAIKMGQMPAAEGLRAE
ncbi:MAG TPA: ABC transporter permease [Anaerolineales bacterium]|nr:ABC transporter permease [Anaerolineales bacterium]